MVTHIAHATATFAELSLAMSIAMLTKIILPPPIIDSLARETTLKRLETGGETWFVKIMYRVACAISDGIRGVFSYSASLSFMLALTSLFGLAFCPTSSDKVDYLVFAVSLLSFILISSYVYSAREVLIKTGEAPLVEPVK